MTRSHSLYFRWALVVWVFSEFKQSEEIQARVSTPNDIRLAREIVAYRAWTFAYFLRDHDFHSGIDGQYLSEAIALVVDWQNGLAAFQDKRLIDPMNDFCEALDDFIMYFVAHSTPSRLTNARTQRVLPDDVNPDDIHVFDDPESARLVAEVSETNRLATEAWKQLDVLASLARDKIPEALDSPLKSGWIRTEDRE